MRKRGAAQLVSIVVVAFAIAAPVAAAMLADRYAVLFNRPFFSSREQRLIHFFGECEPGGYGYLKRILAVYSVLEPNPTKRPTIRYRDYNRRSEYLFAPARFEADPSIVVGVGITGAHMEGYRIVHQQGACFTAVRRASEGRWAPLVRALQGTDD